MIFNSVNYLEYYCNIKHFTQAQFSGTGDLAPLTSIIAPQNV